MSEHKANMDKVRQFLNDHDDTFYSYRELAERTSTSISSTKSIVRALFKEGLIDKQLVKDNVMQPELSGERKHREAYLKSEIVVYIAWKGKNAKEGRISGA